MLGGSGNVIGYVCPTCRDTQSTRPASLFAFAPNPPRIKREREHHECNWEAVTNGRREVLGWRCSHCGKQRAR